MKDIFTFQQQGSIHGQVGARFHRAINSAIKVDRDIATAEIHKLAEVAQMPTALRRTK
jgi:hypothetical protein